MKRMFGWAGAALLAAALTLGAQPQGPAGPRGVDKDGDGKCDICGRPVSQIGQGQQGRRAGMGRGPRNGRGMRGPNCPCPNCPAVQSQQQQQQQTPQPKK